LSLLLSRLVATEPTSAGWPFSVNSFSQSARSYAIRRWCRLYFRIDSHCAGRFRGGFIYRWFLFHAHPLRDDAGTILKWYGTNTDIDDWKQAQEELRKTQAELSHVTRVMTMGQLTASIAHEINQPLSGIMTNAGTCLRMLDNDPPNIDGARVTARRTIRDAKLASDVITRLRDLFRKEEVAAESVDLNDATREVIALSLNELQNNSVEVQFEFAENLPAVKGDRIQIQQVILNLLRNASDAMREVYDRPRQLLIKTERDNGNNIQLTVRDTGSGFAANVADRLFESFYTTKSDGMGIGLSISRSIIEAHGGHLWASANDGPGSSFAFSIPHDRNTGA
jgi:C4-dicarboxylate-specific signal transduction histidine kinase